MSASTENITLPRSYMTDVEKAGMRQNAVYVCESIAAHGARDEETALAWLALAELPESAKAALIAGCGEEFLKARGFKL